METYPSREAEKPVLFWILITATPEGEAPLDVRESWIGTVLPVREDSTKRISDRHDGNANTYPVITEDAIKALRLQGRGESADWWRFHFEAGIIKNELHFTNEECEKISYELATMYIDLFIAS